MSYQHEILGYEVLATLGYGARSTIYAVQDKDCQVYALKQVIKQSQEDQRFVDQAILEHEIASRLDHPSLRKSYKLIKQRNFIRTTEVYVLMEMVDGQTLEQHQPQSVAEMVQLFAAVAGGLAVMHAAGFVHADIKPNNIIATDRNEVKLIDFGQSCATGTVKERIQGTPDYIAPEQVLRRPITPLTDVFNLGATMYWLLTRQHIPTMIPRGGEYDIRKRDQVTPPHTLNPAIPSALSALIVQCVATDPTQRPENMGVVRDRLKLALNQFERTPTRPRPRSSAPSRSSHRPHRTPPSNNGNTPADSNAESGMESIPSPSLPG
jgi:serine/threonine-protein kinase